MSFYKCNECGMSVKTSCGECDNPLEDGFLDMDDGSKLEYPNANMQSVQILMER